jgi:hypothetical protein
LEYFLSGETYAILRLLGPRERLMKIGKSGLVLWSFYASLAAFAIYSNWQETTLTFSGQLGGIKAIIWLGLLGFLGYSVYCSFQENFFRSVTSIAALHWGRQIGADLYLGLLIGLLIISLNDGFVIALFWLVPILVYANLAILLYVALHFDEIVLKLVDL